MLTTYACRIQEKHLNLTLHCVLTFFANLGCGCVSKCISNLDAGHTKINLFF